MRSGSDWIQTATGRQFWPLDPAPDDVDIHDIAHALSNLCRFSGHVKSFYSVAQHSVLVSLHCDPADALWGLLHDASEAYLVDVPRPIKPHLLGYREMERRVMDAVCARFGLNSKESASVKHADNVLLATEKRDLMAPPPTAWSMLPAPLTETILPLPPESARMMFRRRFNELTRAP